MSVTLLGNKKGYVLVEALLAIVIFVTVLVLLLDAGTSSFKVSALAEKNIRANFLAQEFLEAARGFRDGTTWIAGLATANTGSANPYRFVLAGSPFLSWSLVSGAETNGIFTKSVVFDRVSRDTITKNIESTYNPSHDDPNTRKVTVTVSWESKNLVLATYLTNWK